MATLTHRRRSLAPLVCVTLIVLSACLADAQQVDPKVMFFALEGGVPRGLRDLQAFGLSRETTAHGAPHLSGWVMTDRDDPDSSTSDMRTVRDDGRTLSFTAKTKQGYLVTFDGRFLHRGNLRPFLNKGVPVVEGVARKFRAGRKVAEGRIRFSCGTGD